jgi:hypothetical protein
MEISSMTIYLLTLCDGVLVLFALMFSLGLVSVVYWYVNHDLNGGWKPNFCRWGIALMIVGIMGGIFIPSTKEAAMIYGLPKILASETIQDAVKNINEFLSNKPQ